MLHRADDVGLRAYIATSSAERESAVDQRLFAASLGCTRRRWRPL